MENNVGWYETAVASVIMWRHAMEEEIRNHLEELGLFLIPLKFWKENLGDYMNDVRRYNGIGLKNEKIDARAAAYIRKITNLSGRDLKKADFEKEYANTTPEMGAKQYPVSKKLSTV